MKSTWYRNCFYFAKGERYALIVLLSLIASAWMMIRFFHSPDETAVVKSSGDLSTGRPSTVASAETSPQERPFYQPPPRREKFPIGTVVELNTADTTTLQKIPGIGSTFSRRIVDYRRRLGGYHSVSQLVEVKGIDQERYEALKGWFYVDTTLLSSTQKKHRYPRREKFPIGTVVELNTADTTTLQKIPGIGSTFSRRIVDYRRRLGGYHSVSQLVEVKGIDQERYEALKGWFCVDTTLIRCLSVNTSFDTP